MSFTNKLKIILWLIIVGLLSYPMAKRLDPLINGAASASDITIFIIWIAVLVAPLFQEFAFLGISWKRDMDKLRTDVKEQMITLRSEIQNTINMRTEISPHIYLTPPADSELPYIEKSIQTIVAQTLKEQGIKKPTREAIEQLIPESTQYLFSVRYTLETELANFWNQYLSRGKQRRFLMNEDLIKTKRYRTAPSQILLYLTDEGIINLKLAEAIRDVLAICNQAIHGEEVSEVKSKFVRNVTGYLIESLRALKPETEE